MGIDEKVRTRFLELLKTGGQLRQGNKYGQALNQTHAQACVGWLAAAQNIVHLVVGNSSNPYRTFIDKVCSHDRGYCIPENVGEATVILESLLQDIDSGLLASIEDQTKASVFDDFLDHAKEYAKQKRPKEAGVIAGVVFEDTLRSICKNEGIGEKGEKLDSLIDALVKKGTLTQVKAKRAKVAAHVRTKATHAQWDEYELVSIRKVRFLKKADADFGRNSHQSWPDVPKLSSLSCSFSNQDALLPWIWSLPPVGDRFRLWPAGFWPAPANCRRRCCSTHTA